jgi:pSer/pThr/pTyr-binding forkhead associated (FHA) protein
VDEPLAVALKFGFLAVLYLFLLWVARSAQRDLTRGETAEPVRDEGPEPILGRRRSRAVPERPGVQPRLEVVAAMGFDPGTLLDLSGGAIMGRADGADIKVEDQYASSNHARIYPRGEFMYIEDMGSTNGTYLNGRALGTSERLKPSDVIRIGDTEYRYEE